MDQPRPCLLFALRREALFFWKYASHSRRLADSPCPAWHCDFLGKPVLVVETGVGRPAVAKALKWALDGPLCPPRIISAGFSGALQAGLAVGDLVWAKEIVDAQGGGWEVAASSIVPVPNARSGRLLTLGEIVGEPSRKQQLGQQFQALAVDMETAEVARWCQQRGVSFACLRVISDDWKTSLAPQLADVLSRGRVAPLRLLAAVVRQPRIIKELWRLGCHTHFAAGQLAQGLGHLLQAR